MVAHDDTYSSGLLVVNRLQTKRKESTLERTSSRKLASQACDRVLFANDARTIKNRASIC